MNTDTSLESNLSNIIFDTIDQPSFSGEYSPSYLNRYFRTGHMDMILDDDEAVNQDAFNESLDIQAIHSQEESDGNLTEAILSKRLSQLSTTNENETAESSAMTKRSNSGAPLHVATTSKRARTNDDEEEDVLIVSDEDVSGSNQQSPDIDPETEPIPTYLAVNHQAFVEMAVRLIRSIKTISIYDIHEIALLKHRIGALHIRQDITQIYLRSVMGTLNENDLDIVPVDRRVWPAEVKSLVLTRRQAAAPQPAPPPEAIATTLDMTDANVQHVCEALLQRHLKERHEQIDRLTKKLESRRRALIAFSPSMNEAIDQFVEQQGLRSLKIKRDFQIAMIKYYFDSEVLERKFRRENPNEYQIQTMKRLALLRCESDKSRREITELKERVFYNKPPSDLILTCSTPPPSPAEATDRQLNSIIVNKDQVLRAHQILDSMAAKIRDAERKHHRHQSHFDHELSKMWQKHRDLVKDQGMTNTILDIIQQRLATITRRWEDFYAYRVDYFLKNTFENQSQLQRSTRRMSRSFNLLLTVQHPFTGKQLLMLNRGPTYSPLCQMYVTSTMKSSSDIVKACYIPFKHQLSSLFQKYHINIALSMEIQKKAYDLFKEHFSGLIPYSMKQRATFEKHVVHSIRCCLDANDLILQRTADNLNTFYVANSKDFEKRCQRYLLMSDDYELMLTSEDEESNVSAEAYQVQLKDMIDSMNVLLDTLKKHKSLDPDIIDRLHIDSNKVKLPYIQFLPDVSKDPRISVVPFIVAKDSATWKIGQYINQLIRPFVTKTLQPTTFRDEIDFLRKLNTYATTERRLRSTTVFCALKIKNFFALETHQNMIDTVGYFLQDHLLSNRFGDITILTIKNLLHIFLHNNVFIYKEDIYKIERGSPPTMPLSETLANIYLSVWQKKILKELRDDNELFGRYKNEIFFTWNKSSSSSLFSFVQQIRENIRTVRFDISNGSTVQFMNICVQNREGRLYTRVHHESNIQRYRLPYVIGYSKQAYSDWFRSALIRAVCACSSVEDFHDERVYLELTLLANGYTQTFVEMHLSSFFEYFHADTMRYSTDQDQFIKFRSQWFDYMILQNDLTAELYEYKDRGSLIEMNYIYEYGPCNRFDQEFYKLWLSYFDAHPRLGKDKFKLLLKAKHYQTLHALFSSKKRKSILE